MKKSAAKTTRRSHSDEFRAEALRPADQVGAAAAARQLNLHPSQLYQWRTKAQHQEQYSHEVLAQALGVLNINGYITAIRGKNGGLRLRARPEDINLGQLVRDMEQDLALVECFSDGDNCHYSGLRTQAGACRGPGQRLTPPCFDR